MLSAKPDEDEAWEKVEMVSSNDYNLIADELYMLAKDKKINPKGCEQLWMQFKEDCLQMDIVLQDIEKGGYDLSVVKKSPDMMLTWHGHSKRLLESITELKNFFSDTDMPDKDRLLVARMSEGLASDVVKMNALEILAKLERAVADLDCVIEKLKEKIIMEQPTAIPSVSTPDISRSMFVDHQVTYNSRAVSDEQNKSVMPLAQRIGQTPAYRH